ncbi:P-loop ATPase, Sll1717 family [Azotobacter salinestris]|uniref:P-loop ATPase, Sll1717 family n=1 Tax=Azotobacter salinestris TaxID=69964 RepID=UPI0032DE33D1
MDVGLISTFGEVAAEDDNSILDYFVETDSVAQIFEGNKFLILGRKGSGKTALFRYFNERQSSSTISLPLNLRGYPWSLHAKRADGDSSSAEQYEASWRFLIATEFAQLVISKLTGTSKWTDEAKSLVEFFNVNYGGVNVTLEDVLRPPALQLSKASFEPVILGCRIGSISMERRDASGFSGHL